MQSNFMRAALGIGAVALAVVLLIVLKGSDDNGESGGAGNGDAVSDAGSGGKKGAAAGAAHTVPTIVVKDGAPVGGVRDLTYVEGDRIRFQVDSDVSDEIHIHGYDISKDIEAGGSARFDFPAGLEGVFEVELEGRTAQIAELRVNP
jgi:hypothetical protein